MAIGKNQPGCCCAPPPADLCPCEAFPSCLAHTTNTSIVYLNINGSATAQQLNKLTNNNCNQWNLQPGNQYIVICNQTTGHWSFKIFGADNWISGPNSIATTVCGSVSATVSFTIGTNSYVLTVPYS